MIKLTKDYTTTRHSWSEMVGQEFHGIAHNKYGAMFLVYNKDTMRFSYFIGNAQGDCCNRVEVEHVEDYTKGSVGVITEIIGDDWYDVEDEELPGTTEDSHTYKFFFVVRTTKGDINIEFRNYCESYHYQGRLELKGVTQ